MKRKVIKIENKHYSIHSHGKGSNMLYLECGHVVRRKGSIPVPQTVFCKECKMELTNSI